MNTTLLGTIANHLRARIRRVTIWSDHTVGGWPSPKVPNPYVGDLIAGETISSWEGPCGIAVSMHCRMTAFLDEADETCAT